MHNKVKFNIKQISHLSLLFAVTVILVIIESFIPPIPALPPGVKLGLSNVIIMYCLFYLGKSEAFTILFLKSFYVFLTRGFIAFLMSISGGFLSIIIIILLMSLKKIKLSYIMMSVSASVAHNIAQLIVSALLLGSFTTFYYSPILIVSGVIMGTITGTVLKVMIPAMNRLEANHN